MSYFYKNKIYDSYSFDSTIYANDGDVFINDYIEIFNNEEIVLDFSNTDLVCSNEKIKGSELHKIKIDWGDDTEDVLVKTLEDKLSTIGNEYESWRVARHLYNTDKRNFYLTNDVVSLPKITVFLYNTYNDIIKISIPFKLVYKSLYDLNCRFDLISANTGNDCQTTFVMKEGQGNSISIVQSINPKLHIKYDDYVYISDKKESTDYSEEYVDEDNAMWAWDQIPYVQINTKLNNYDTEDGNFVGIKCECVEKTVPIEEWTPRVEKLSDEGLIKLHNVLKDENGAFEFYFYGGDEQTIQDLDRGIYKIDLNVTGINDIVGYTEPKLVSVPSDENYTNDVVFKGYIDDDNVYNFEIQKKEDNQWCYLKETKLIFKSQLIDNSDDGLTIDESKWEQADESFKFEYFLDLEKPIKDGFIPIPKKSLPNGKYNIYALTKDLIGNETDRTTLQSKEFKWKYNNIGSLTSSLRKSGDVLFTNVLQKNGSNLIPFGDFKGDYDYQSNEYVTNKTNVPNDTTIVEWTVSNPSEMDKIQLKIEKITDDNSEIIFNEKKHHNLWSTEKMLYTFDGKQAVTENEERATSYYFSYTLPHVNYGNGKYKITTSHILDMEHYMGERKIEQEQILNLFYDVPIVKISQIKPFFKFNKITSSWQPYVLFDFNFSKDDVTDVIIRFDYEDGKYRTEEIPFIKSMTKISDDCFGDSKTFSASLSCRDVKDVIYRRREENPEKKSLSKTDIGYLKCHTSIPAFQEHIGTFDMFYDEDDNMLTGLDVMTESAQDVFRTHVYQSNNGKKYYKFQDENGVEPNYYEDNYSYFMLKKYYPTIKMDDGSFIKDEDNSFYRFVQADLWEYIEEKKWSKLVNVDDLFESKIPVSYNYEQEYDKAIVSFSNENLNVPEDIIYTNIKLFKDGTLTHDLFTNQIQKEFTIPAVDLGDYKIDLEYSSVTTNTVEPTVLSQNLKVYANKDQVLSDVTAKSNLVSSGQYTVTFNWKRNHKLATHLRFVMRSSKGTHYFDNALQNDSYTPPVILDNGETITYWFEMTSPYIDFGTGLTQGEVFRDTYVV